MRPSVLKTCQYAIAGFGLLCMLVVQTCQTLPDDLQRTNPLDANNPVTHGDPFHLRARIAQGGVLLEWDAPAMGGIQSYVVYRQMNEAGPYAQRVSVPVSQSSYVDTVSNGHTYRWYVLATGENGESSSSNIRSVRINMEPVVVIAGGRQYTPTRQVELTVRGGGSDRVDVLAEAKEGSTLVVKVPGGIQVQVISADGEWYRVKLPDGKEGWLPSSKVKK